MIGQLIGVVIAIRLLGIVGGGSAIGAYYLLKPKLGWGGALAVGVAIGFIVWLIASTALRAAYS